MKAREQVQRIKTFTYKDPIRPMDDTCIELIKHEDLHLWLYYNGQLTDVMLPRHINMYDYSLDDIYEELNYGCSFYNETRVKDFFKKVMPEYFL